jgi:hypothetical protein
MMSQATRLAEADVPSGIQDNDQRESLTVALHESFVASFRFAMLLAAVLSALSAVCAAFTIDSRKQ